MLTLFKIICNLININNHSINLEFKIMSYNATVSYAYQTSKGHNGVAVETVNAKKKSDGYLILALIEKYGNSAYKILDVKWE